MPDPRLATLTSEDGRTYTHPITREHHVSSTTVMKLMPKYMTGWAGDQAAGAAWDNRQWLIQMTTREQAVAAFGRASDRTRNAAGDHGRLVHKGCELLAMSYAGWDLTPEQQQVLSVLLLGQQGVAVQQGVLRFAEFWKTYVKRALFLEQTVWGNGWAGTFDWILELLDGRIALVDGKSNKAIYRDPKIQLSSYWGAPIMINAEGVETPMPHIDVCAVLHLPQAGGYSFLDMGVNQTDLDYFERLLEDWYYEQDVPQHPGVPIPAFLAPGVPGPLCGNPRNGGTVTCDKPEGHTGDHHGKSKTGSRNYTWANQDAPGAAALPPFADAGRVPPEPPVLRPVSDLPESSGAVREPDAPVAPPGVNVQGGEGLDTVAPALGSSVPGPDEGSGDESAARSLAGASPVPAPRQLPPPGLTNEEMVQWWKNKQAGLNPETGDPLDNAQAYSAQISAKFNEPGRA